MAKAASKSAVGILNDMLSYQKLRFGRGRVELHPERVELQAWADTIALLLRPHVDKACSIYLDPCLLHVVVQADTARLTQVISNFISKVHSSR
jgi:signal transduction histidine kinase